MNPHVTKSALVLGGGGFIGAHMVDRLKSDGFRVRAVDLKPPEFRASTADEFITGDLSDPAFCRDVFGDGFAEVYQFAADMGGAGYIFTGSHDADIMSNSAIINLNAIRSCVASGSRRIFFSSSACVYPKDNQTDPDRPVCRESTAYPANPDSEYGWEKLFSERLYLAFGRNHGTEVRIARYHNVFGPFGTWDGGKEKAPAAICRKVALASDGGEIEIWGDGRQTRSFLYIDECIEGTLKLMRSDRTGPYNIGSEEMVSIRQLVGLVAAIAGKTLSIRAIPGPAGVNGRNSDNAMIQREIGWSPKASLRDGLEPTYRWIRRQIEECGA